jgi:hypothetical protein
MTDEHDVWADCTAFVGRHICVILLSLITMLTGAATYFYKDSNEKLTQNTEELQEIRQSVGSMEGDLKLIRYRLDLSIPQRVANQ